MITRHELLKFKWEMVMGIRRIGNSISEIVWTFDIPWSIMSHVYWDYLMEGIITCHGQWSYWSQVHNDYDQLELYAVIDKHHQFKFKSHQHSMQEIPDAYPVDHFNVIQLPCYIGAEDFLWLCDIACLPGSK